MGYTELRKKLLEGVEDLARELAAEKMGLTNDPAGDTVPYDLYRQCVPEARKILGLD